MTNLLTDAELAELRGLNEADLPHVGQVRLPVVTSGPGGTVVTTYPAAPDATYPCRASAVGATGAGALERLIAGAPGVAPVYEVAFPAGTVIPATAQITVTGTTPRSDGGAVAFVLTLAVQGGSAAAVVSDAVLTLVTAVPAASTTETVLAPAAPGVRRLYLSGDSYTSRDFQPDAALPPIMRALLVAAGVGPQWDVVDLGHSGETVVQLDARAPTEVDAMRQPTDRLLFNAFINGFDDATFGGQTFADFQTWLDHRLAAGWTPDQLRPWTSPPWGDAADAQHHAAWHNVNLLIAAHCAALGIRCVPIEGDPDIGYWGAQLDTRYFYLTFPWGAPDPDHHPTPAGAQKIVLRQYADLAAAGDVPPLPPPPPPSGGFVLSEWTKNDHNTNVASGDADPLLPSVDGATGNLVLPGGYGASFVHTTDTLRLNPVMTTHLERADTTPGLIVCYDPATGRHYFVQLAPGFLTQLYRKNSGTPGDYTKVADAVLLPNPIPAGTAFVVTPTHPTPTSVRVVVTMDGAQILDATDADPLAVTGAGYVGYYQFGPDASHSSAWRDLTVTGT